MVIKAIFFGMNGVLIYMTISVEQAFLKIYQELGLSFSLEQVSLVYKEVHNWWRKKFLSGQIGTRDAFVEYDYRMLKPLGVKDDLQELSEKVQIYWDNFPESGYEEIYPEVKDVLRKLREKEVNLAVVSHRPLTMSLKSLEKHSVEKYFQLVVSPAIAKASKGKMSPEMWQYALNMMGVKPNEVLHVDDGYEWIIGAKKAGIQPVLIDRKGIYSSVTSSSFFLPCP